MLLPADRLGEEFDILARIRRGEHIDHFDTRRVCKDGSIADISLTISAIKDVAGRMVGVSQIARDVAIRKHAQEQQALVVEEMKHRIKNTLATVPAMAHQTLRAIPAEDLSGFVGRLHSLATSSDLLTKENWDRASLFDLANCALELFGTGKDGRFSIGGPQVWLDAATSTQITMVLHELATNASKFGALSEKEGRSSLISAIPSWSSCPMGLFVL
jgi:two-component sensor histidine kinase